MWMKKEKIISLGRPDFIAMCDALIFWNKIELFLKKGKIYSPLRGSYEKEMKQFNTNVDKFYEAGKKCFLKDGKKLGGFETAYIHTLKFYMKDIVAITYKRHGCGVGVFTMQGVRYYFCLTVYYSLIILLTSFLFVF